MLESSEFISCFQTIGPAYEIYLPRLAAHIHLSSSNHSVRYTIMSNAYRMEVGEYGALASGNSLTKLRRTEGIKTNRLAFA